MSYLAAQQIIREVRSGRLGIDPFDESLVQPASVDLRLGPGFRVLRSADRGGLDPVTEPSEWDEHDAGPVGVVTLLPGSFSLGATFEYIAMPDNMLGRLEGKSSLGRQGVRVHSTAGFIDPGFCGTITLELSVDVPVPVRLYVGQAIGQLSLAYLDERTDRPYGSGRVGSHYQGQVGPTASRIAERFTHGLPDAPPRTCRAHPPGTCTLRGLS